MKALHFSFSASLAALLVCANAWAACPSISTASRYVLNGAEVTDNKTGLIWARCSAGQSWSGSTCTGTANSSYSHEAALTYAQSQSGWRLPTIKELFSLVDLGCSNPAIDSAVFPNTAYGYWSTTPQIGSTTEAAFINFSSGGTSWAGRANAANALMGVRLVRATP